MPSINLLPENFTIEAFKKREKIAVYIVGFVFLAATVSIGAWVMNEKQVQAKNVAQLDSEISQVKKEIKYNVESSSLLASEYSKNDIDKLLKEHVYFTKGAALLKGLVVKDAYVTGVTLQAGGSDTFDVEIGVAARDYDVMANELSLLQDTFWIKSFKQGEIKLEKEGGVVTTAKAKVRRDLFLYHDQYFDFGIETLAAACDRFIVIDGYNVALKTEKNAITGTDENSVVVTFSGKTYDSAKLDAFEKKLNGRTDIVKELKISKATSAEDKPGVISFRGNMVLKY
jgi:Tfp pilus assembly protein PilN